MAITFPVSNVPPAPREPLAGQVRGATTLLGRPVEASGSSAAAVVPATWHGLLQTVGTAFADHHPLVLGPDAVWLCIAQGFALHVNQFAERLRHKFVRHPGKARIVVRRDDFEKGSPANAWPEVFGAFSDAIAAHIGKQRDLVVCAFSTTGACERAASEIVLMDAMKSFFDYRFETMCGIPEITLEGTVDDWTQIRRRARALEEYELGWWVEGLGPVLDQLVATAQGRVDTRFWGSLFKLNSMSGGPYVSGWINALLPYRSGHDGKGFIRNPWATDWAHADRGAWGGGVARSGVPTGVSIAPFQWDYLGTMFPMELLGGFVGVAQDEGSLALRPAIGWAVRDA